MPARLPNTIKLERGTLRKSRVKNEPQPPPGTPEPPSWLSADAVAVWNEFAPLCVEMKTLTPADVNAMARYCEMVVQWRTCQAVIESKGMTYELRGDDGEVKCIVQRPEVSISNKLSVQLRALEADLGLNAMARGKIDLPSREAKRPSLAASARKRG